VYRCGGQFYNLHSDEVDLEENEKIIELSQKASPDKSGRPSLFYSYPKNMLTKKKEKKKAKPLEGRGKQGKEARNK
jgi:hypothetical protein